MHSKVWSRRELLSAAAVLGVALPSAPAGAKASRGVGPIRFADRRAEMLAMIRVQADVAGRIAPWWYTGYIYGMRPGEQPRKLVRFEGSEINLFTPQADGTFVQTGRTTSFFSDIDSEQVLESWVNPYTGATVAVRANLLGGAGRAVWSEAGIDPQFGPAIAAGGAAPTSSPQPLHITWTRYGSRIWVRHDRAYPPGMPAPIGESSTSLIERRDLDNHRLTSIPALFASTYMAPWPTWMGMQGQPGHVIWHADGLKLDRIEDLPAPYLDRLRRLHPQQLVPLPG